MKRAAPSFGSFPVADSATQFIQDAIRGVDTHAEKQYDASREERRYEKKSDRTEKKRKRRVEHAEVHGKKSRKNEETKEPQPVKESFISGDGWFQDPTKDNQRRDYFKDPSYNRFGDGYVVGLSTDWRIPRQFSKHSPIVEIESRNFFTNRSFLKSLSRTKQLISLIPSEQARQSSSFPTNEDFVALPRVKTLSKKISELGHEPNQDYRSLGGFIKDGDILEDEWEDELSESYDELDGRPQTKESLEDLQQRKNVEFGSRLKISNHKDVNVYLEMIAFEEELDRLKRGSKISKGKGKKDEKRTAKATMDIQLSIAEQGLKYNPNSVPLVIAYMRIYSNLAYEEDAVSRKTDKILSRWQAFLDAFPNEIDLWIAFLDWTQTNFVGFNVQILEERFGYCIELMKKKTWELAREKRGERTSLETNMLYIFLRWCTVLWEAGYSERAIYAFQSLCELTFRRPASLSGIWYKALFDKALSSLRSFMDSNVPKFGDPGAQGWSANDHGVMPLHSKMNAMDSMNAMSDVSLKNVTNEVELWYNKEKWLSQVDTQPISIEEEEQSGGDPHRVVLFDDIKSMMFPIEEEESKLQLAYAFLKFLGFPIVPPDVSTSAMTLNDSFLSSDFAKLALQETFWKKDDEDNLFRVPFKMFPLQIEHLFCSTEKSDATWFSYLDQNYIRDLPLEFASNVFDQFRQLNVDFFITIFQLSLETFRDPKRSLELLKTSLACDRENLFLVDSFARVTMLDSGFKDARKIYGKAIAAGSANRDIHILFRSWAELEWENGKDDIALEVLLAQVGCSEFQDDIRKIPKQKGRPQNPASILRASQKYTDLLMETYTPSGHISLRRNRTNICISKALFDFLLRIDIDAVSDDIETHIQRLRSLDDPNTAVEEEEVSCWFAKFLYHVQKRNSGFDRSKMRSFLETAIDRWPNNTIFLSLYMKNEDMASYLGRLRTMLDSKVLSKENETVQGYLFAIYSELHSRPSANLIPTDSIRRLFYRALKNNPRTESSVALCSLWIEFEIRQLSSTPKPDTRFVKEAIDIAIKNCPWKKDFYLYPFSPELQNIYTNGDRKKFYENMLHKQIRIRVDVESIIIAFGRESEEEDDFEISMAVEDSMMMDGERELNDIRQLMPFEATDMVVQNENLLMD